MLDLTQEEIDELLFLDTENELFETNDDEELLTLKNELDYKREEYTSFYEDVLKDKIANFIENNDYDLDVAFEARIKKDQSVLNSLNRKNIELDELKDYLGLRFITVTKEDAYTLAGLFMINECVPRDREEELESDKDKYHAYQTRDYFKRPKVDNEGNVQYSGIHIFLEKDGKKFELQIHDVESYENANLTHDEYKTRKAIKRETEELDVASFDIYNEDEL